MHEYITSIGLRRSQLDHCLYIGTVDSITVLLAVFVDDILIASANESVIVKVKSHFHKKFKFKIKYMGLADEFLNIRITQRPGRISIDQELYIRAKKS